MSQPDTLVPKDGNLYRFQDRAPVAALLDGHVSLRDWFDQEATTLKTNSDKTRTKLISQGTKRYFAKCYYSTGFLRGLLAPDRALTVYRHSITLEQAGLPVARPLAYIREGSRWALPTAYFVCEALGDMLDLRHLSDTDDFEKLMKSSDFFVAVAQDIAKLHQLGFCHGDLKWANIMVSPHSHEYRFVDLDGMHKPIVHRSTLFAKDLARFIMNAREKRTPESLIDSFVGSYAQESGLETSVIQRAIEPVYEKLLRRHRESYGVDL